jgi:hypothetical protein
MLSHLCSAIGILIAVFCTIISNDAPEQHGFIGVTGFLSQLCLHLIPTQLAGQDLVWTFHEIMSHVSTDKLRPTHMIR